MVGESMIWREAPVSTPKHPHIKVQLSGQDGNAFTILGACLQAAEKAGLPREQVKGFIKEATEGDYDHLLLTATRWFYLS